MSGRTRASLPWPLFLLAALMLGFLIGPLLSLLGALPMAESSAYFGGGAFSALAVTLFAATVATSLGFVWPPAWAVASEDGFEAAARGHRRSSCSPSRAPSGGRPVLAVVAR